MSKQVSVKAGVPDLYAAKFGLHELGVPREKIMLRVVLGSAASKTDLALFGTYTVGSRHVQVASRDLLSLGNSVLIKSIERYSLKRFIDDLNYSLKLHPISGLQLTSDARGVALHLDGQVVPVSVKSMYASGARVYAVLGCLQKLVKIALINGKVELFDFQRRKLVGASIIDGKLVLLRSFQHHEIQNV